MTEEQGRRNSIYTVEQQELMVDAMDFMDSWTGPGRPQVVAGRFPGSPRVVMHLNMTPEQFRWLLNELAVIGRTRQGKGNND